MNYKRGRYPNGALAIQAYEGYEPYATVTVNVPGISEILPENQVVVNHDLHKGSIAYRRIARDLFKKEITKITYGYAQSVIVELKPDWENR